MFGSILFLGYVLSCLGYLHSEHVAQENVSNQCGPEMPILVVLLLFRLTVRR